jgi:hypothetical protein
VPGKESVDPRKAFIVCSEQNVHQVIAISDFCAQDRLYAILLAVLNELPGIAGGIDICKCKRRGTIGPTRLNQFFGSERAVTEAEECLTIQIHSLLYFVSGCVSKAKPFY